MFAPKDVLPILNGLSAVGQGKQFFALDESIVAERIAEDKRFAKAFGSVFRPASGEVPGTAQYMGTTPSDEKKAPPKSTSKSSHLGVAWFPGHLELLKEELKQFAFLYDCGAGAFGRVWLVQPNNSDTIVALKVMRKFLSKRYEEELRGLTLYMRRIKDFHDLIEIYEVNETEHFLFYTMEAAFSMNKKSYIPMTLETVLNAPDEISTEKIVKITKALLKGADCLHKHYLVHHDIKPNNVIIINGKVKLGDIGMITKESSFVYGGTYEFIPPDLRKVYEPMKWKGRGIDCDLYAIGKVLYLLFSRYDLSRFPEIEIERLNSSQNRRLNFIINKSCSDLLTKRYKSALRFFRDIDRSKDTYSLENYC